MLDAIYSSPSADIINWNYLKLIKHKIEITEPILLEIGKLADKHNIEVYVVGGYVRDALLGKIRTDIDCTVVGDAIEFAKVVAKHFHSKAVIYERFRTALVPIGGTNIEFVGTRKEEYLPDSRNPITTDGTLEDDLKRRDFTVNAMAASINNGRIGEIIDLFNGYQHINDKKLLTPLDPTITYSDDPLRMMRAARFAAQLQFELAPSSIDAITSMCNRISIISQERICDELMKIMATSKPSIGFHILYKTGVLQHVFPELTALVGVESKEDNQGQLLAHKDVFYHTLKVLDNISEKSDNLWLRFAALFHDIAKPRTKRFIEGSGWHFFGHEERGARMVEPIFRKLKLPLDHIDYIKKLIRLHLRPMQLVDGEVTDSAVRRLAVSAGDALEDLFLLCRCDITSKNPNLTQKYLNNYDIVAQKVIDVQEKDKLREFQSPVRGEEIMETCNIPPSKLVGIIKTNIENAILDGVIPNEYDAAKSYFLQHKSEWMAG
ncbi:MAG: CCA tRNA nucleotidyltransferase [Ignavibacteria bacterium]|jgi:poly(A) polymerase|nr:CCA tRNA nucleotidyltransferase [Ignavibacteria bacterium]